MARSSETRIEDAIDAERDNAQLYLVYADALTARGDPRGELIVMQTRGLPAETFLAAHPELVPGGIITWRWGFVNELSIGWFSDYYDVRDDADAAVGEVEVTAAMLDEAAATFAHPSLRFLDELVLSPVATEIAERVLAQPFVHGVRSLALHVIDWMDMERVVAAIAAHRWPRLSRLTIEIAHFEELSGPAGSADVYSETEHEEGFRVSDELLPAFAAATPALDFVRLVGGRIFNDFAHPSVRELELVGHPIDALAWYGGACDTPKLEKLAITAVDDEYRHAPLGSYIGDGLDPDLLPSLRSLAYGGSWDEGNDDTTLFRILAELPILRRLEHLRLPYLRSEYDGGYLEDLAPRFHHLASFTVETRDLDDDPAFAARTRVALPALIADDD